MKRHKCRIRLGYPMREKKIRYWACNGGELMNSFADISIFISNIELGNSCINTMNTTVKSPN